MKQRVCFISPHPDDIELFCGGALLHHYNQNDSIQICMITDGENGNALQGEIRNQEAQQRYALLPAAEIAYFKLKDGYLNECTQLAHVLQEFLIAKQPDIIYLPEGVNEYSRYLHKDHLHLGQIVTQLCTLHLTNVILRHYHSKKNNYFLDVTEHFADNRQAVKYYKNKKKSLRRLCFREKIYQKYHGLLNRCSYAEAYRTHMINTISNIHG